MTITEEDRQLLVGALGSLGVALSCHDHTWSEGERAIYEQAFAILGAPFTGEFERATDPEAPDEDDDEDDDDDSGEEWRNQG